MAAPPAEQEELLRARHAAVSQVLRGYGLDYDSLEPEATEHYTEEEHWTSRLANGILWMYWAIIGMIMRCMQRLLRRRGQQHFMMKAGDGGNLHGHSTIKVPPAWDPRSEDTYPFRKWIRDLGLWAVTTDMDENRQAGAVALQLGGLAREVASTIPPGVLRDGDGFRTGLQVLINELMPKFHPLDDEVQIRSITDLMGFRMKSNETFDDALHRFELVRARATSDGAFNVSWPGLAWMVLKFLHVPATTAVMVLQQFGGAMPNNENAYYNFVSHLRRISHLTDARTPHDHNVKAPAKSIYHYDDERGDYDNSRQQNAYQTSASSSSNWAPTTYDSGGSPTYVNDQNHNAWEEDEFVNDIYDEDVTFEDVEGLNSNEADERILLEFAFAQRRFRKWFGGKGKGKRRTRKGKGKHRAFLASDNEDPWTYSNDPWMPAAYATNPIGRDGKPLRCSICDSPEHLRARCPKKGSGKGKGKQDDRSRAFLQKDVAAEPIIHQTAAAEATSTQPCGAPPTIFLGMASSRDAKPPGNAEDWKELDFTTKQQDVNENSLAIVAAVKATAPTKTPPPPPLGAPSLPAPRWEADRHRDPDPLGLRLVGEGAAGVTRTIDRRQPLSIEELIPRPRPPAKGGKGKGHKGKWPNPFRLNSYLEWWDSLQNEEALAFHQRTRLSEEEEGLLVDVGAIDNLCGSDWMARQGSLATRAGRANPTTRKIREIRVEGVGKDSQSACVATQVPVALPDGREGFYEAPIVEGPLPALWGLRSMREQRVVIDVYNRKLYMMGPGGYKIQVSPATSTYNLQEAKSGHLLLPVSRWNDVKSNNHNEDKERVHLPVTSVTEEGVSTTRA